MARLASLIAAALVAVAAPAAAQALMGGAEARRTFFGIDMQGVHQPSGLRWRECIDSAGKTTYWFADTVDEGRLSIRTDGALCFRYASTGFAEEGCWRIRKLDGAYRFENADAAGGVFVTTATRRVNACPSAETPVS